MASSTFFIWLIRLDVGSALVTLTPKSTSIRVRSICPSLKSLVTSVTLAGGFACWKQQEQQCPRTGLINKICTSQAKVK